MVTEFTNRLRMWFKLSYWLIQWPLVTASLQTSIGNGVMGPQKLATIAPPPTHKRLSGNSSFKEQKNKLNTELRRIVTSYQTGHDEGQDEHFKHAHEDVSRKLYEHDDFLAGVGCARSEADDPAEDDSEHRQHQQQVVLAPPGKLQCHNIILKFSKAWE